MAVFSQMWQVCSTLFWLSYRILIHEGSMPLYLSQSLVLLTPLSCKIQMQSRIADICLILNSSCHGGHLKIRWFWLHPYSLGEALSGWQISPSRRLSNMASASIISFHPSVKKQSFRWEFSVASTGPWKLSEFTSTQMLQDWIFWFLFSKNGQVNVC